MDRELDMLRQLLSDLLILVERFDGIVKGAALSSKPGRAWHELGGAWPPRR